MPTAYHILEVEVPHGNEEPWQQFSAQERLGQGGVAVVIHCIQIVVVKVDNVGVELMQFQGLGQQVSQQL